MYNLNLCKYNLYNLWGKKSNPIQNMDRRLMWKMFDRERDFQWNINDKKVMSSAPTLRKWDSKTLEDNILRKEGGELGNLTKWSEKTLPMAIMTCDDPDMLKTEMMEDHPIAEGELSFPMGHPFWMACGRNSNAAEALNFTTGSYPGSSEPPSTLMGVSFVNFHAQSIADYVRNQRYAKANSNSTNTTEVGSGTVAVGKLLAGSLSYKPCSMNSYPTCERDKTKCDEVTSSHCALIHVPTYPTSDGSAENTVCMADVTIETMVKVDLSKVRNGSCKTFGVLGEIWEDTVDPAHNGFCPLNQGLTPIKLQKSREQWYAP